MDSPTFVVHREKAAAHNRGKTCSISFSTASPVARNCRAPQGCLYSPYIRLMPICAQCFPFLHWYSVFARAWLPPMRPLWSALVLSGTGYRAPSLHNRVTQRRPTESKTVNCCCTKGVEAQEGRAQVHAAPGRRVANSRSIGKK